MTGKRLIQICSPIGSPPSITHISDSGKDQDRFLPIANVSRIMKKSLPTNAKISKEAKESVQECVSEFISFITGEASEKCLREKRKTINGDDLLWAMSTLGFDNYVEILRAYLGKYREIEGEKNVMAKQDDDHSSFNDGQNLIVQNFDGGNYHEAFGSEFVNLASAKRACFATNLKSWS